MRLEQNVSLFDFKVTKTGSPVDGIINFLESEGLSGVTQNLDGVEVGSFYSNNEFSENLRVNNQFANTRDLTSITATTLGAFDEGYDNGFEIT